MRRRSRFRIWAPVHGTYVHLGAPEYLHVLRTRQKVPLCKCIDIKEQCWTNVGEDSLQVLNREPVSPWAHPWKHPPPAKRQRGPYPGYILTTDNNHSYHFVL